MKRIKARAVIVVTLEVPSESTWGAECPIEQVHRQAVEEAHAKIVDCLSGVGRRVIGARIVNMTPRGVTFESSPAPAGVA